MLASQILDHNLADAGQVRLEVNEMLRPARRVTVSDFASEDMVIEVPGGTTRNWGPHATPYMVRPMDMLKSRSHEGLIFVGPARTGKTVALIDGWVSHSVSCDPADFLVVQMTADIARTYSRTRLARLHENSPKLMEQLRAGTHDDNVFDKFYKSGMHLVIGWPSPAQFASRDFKYVALTDYDRMPQNIGRDGSPYATASKRTQTFMSGGMTMAESSPGFDVEDEDPNASRTAHELPPAKGIVSLYNRGTREAFYFQCFECKEWYIPDFPDAFHWVESDDIEEQAASTKFVCRHCGHLDDADTGRRDELNWDGRWCGDGQYLNEAGELVGDPVESNLASFRCPAGAAAFQAPSSIVRNYLQALRDYERTGDEEPLRSTTGQDQGLPYRRKMRFKRRSADELSSRVEPLGHKVIPHGVRFVNMMIDVQKYHWAVAAIGHKPDYERYLIDRFDIRRSSRRVDAETYDPVQPAMFLEDWNLLVSEVIKRRYPLADGSGRTMGVKLTACDSQGYATSEYSVTSNAYEFYRTVIKPMGLHDRFALLRGDKRKGIPRISETYPDSSRKDRKAKARGEIPIWQINVEMIKDSLNMDLGRENMMDRCIHFADWLPESVFEELVAEVKDPKDGWKKPSNNVNNETWDLLTYDRAMLIPLGVERPGFWENPPAWALDWDQNSLVSGPPGTAPKPTNIAGSARKGRRVRNKGIPSV